MERVVEDFAPVDKIMGCGASSNKGASAPIVGNAVEVVERIVEDFAPVKSEEPTTQSLTSGSGELKSFKPNVNSKKNNSVRPSFNNRNNICA